MQENRSYDSYFSRLHFQGQPQSSVESAQPNPNPLGGPPIHPFLTTNSCTTADLEHGWDETHLEIAGGRMDGFTTQNVDPTDPTGSRTMGYYDQRTLPFYYGIANEFSVADRYFASVPGPTFPNRFYLLTGTSFGYTSNVTQIYTQKTIFQSLDEAPTPVSWKIYLASFQVEQLFKYVQDHAAGHVFPIAQYFTDAANGNLPQVSFVESDPFGDVNHESDEHPPANVQVGQKFSHDIVSALVNSPDWPSAAMFQTYDEHGGYYDHVTPPAAVPPDDIAPMVPPGRSVQRVRPLRCARPDDGHLSLLETASRLARRLRPHVDLEIHRDTLWPAVAHTSRRGRRSDARHVRLQPPVAATPERAGCPGRPRGHRRLQRAPPLTEPARQRRARDQN